MITELGHFALIMAVCLSLTQSTLPLIGAARRHAGWTALGQSTAIAIAAPNAFFETLGLASLAATTAIIH